MAKVIITEFLMLIVKKFSEFEANEILDLLESLEKSSGKGKILSSVSGVLIKELKYKKFRFYFITDGHILRFGTDDELITLIIKFVRMSEKKDQQKIIDSLKETLKSLGFDKL